MIFLKTKTKGSILKNIFLFVFLLSLLSCEENQLLELDKEDTDTTIWFEVKNHINEQEYQDAIDDLARISNNFKFDRSRIIDHASAYAGLCGLDLLALVTESGGIGAVTITQFFMSIFDDASSTKLDACNTAISLLETHASDDPSLRTEDENIATMAILMAQIGNSLNVSLDQNNDGVVDIGHNDLCTTTPVTDLMAAEFGANLAKLFQTAANLSVVALLGDVKNQIDQGCAALSGGLNFCSKTDPTSFTATEIQGVRSLLQEGQIFGVGSCTGSPNSLVNCICL